ncbi:hypothetical protein BGZ81_001691, partial [Podila clonocystis]
AMNYIWDMEQNLRTLPEDTFTAPVSRNTQLVASPSTEEAALCWVLDRELMHPNIARR